MITVMFRDGRCQPAICCDECEKLIEDARMGAVVTAGGAGGQCLLSPIFVHKGICLDRAQAKFGGPEETEWADVSTFLLKLVRNAGSSPAELSEMEELAPKA